MKIVGLLSGGKDSIYNLLQCHQKGYEIVCLAHLSRPENLGGNLHILNKEMDSYMYQTVGSEMIDAIAECLNLPLIKRYLLII